MRFIRFLIFLWKLWYLFFMILSIESSKEQHLITVEIICNITNVLLSLLINFKAPLLNKNINSLEKLNGSAYSHSNNNDWCTHCSEFYFLILLVWLIAFVLQKLSPWVGLRKINVSYWGWEDMSPFTNTSLQWLPGEPNDSGFCAYLERAQVSGLRANPCTANTDGLICEKPVGESLFPFYS